MKLDLIKPCSDCPFRSDKPFYLSLSRVKEILFAIIDQDATFSCHKTNNYENDDDAVETAKSQHCAGATIMLEHIEKPNQWMRIAERIGLYDRTKLKMDSPVYRSPEEMIKDYANR